MSSYPSFIGALPITLLCVVLRIYNQIDCISLLACPDVYNENLNKNVLYFCLFIYIKYIVYIYLSQYFT